MTTAALSEIRSESSVKVSFPEAKAWAILAEGRWASGE
jgi:hypothetical protein